MVKQNDLLADLHVHSLNSALGLSTLHEILCGARRSGMRYVGIVDTACTQLLVDTLAGLSSETGVKIIPGVEYTEAISGSGSIDNAYSIMGVHPTEVVSSAIATANNYFECFSNVLGGSAVHGIAHLHKHLPALLAESELAIFYSMMMTFMKDTGKWLEVSPWTTPQEKRALNHILSLAEKESGIKIVFGTGAKYCEDVGRFHDVLELFNTFNIDRKRVINTDETALSQLYDATHRKHSADS